MFSGVNVKNVHLRSEYIVGNFTLSLISQFRSQAHPQTDNCEEKVRRQLAAASPRVGSRAQRGGLCTHSWAGLKSHSPGTPGWRGGRRTPE